MRCFDQNIDPHRRYPWIRILYLRYFSRHRFRYRVAHDVTIRGIKENGEIAGFYELEINGYLANLFVDPDYQRKGYGKALYEDALRLVKKRGLKSMTLDANVAAVPFYEAMGAVFVKEKKVMKISMVEMRHDLR